MKTLKKSRLGLYTILITFILGLIGLAIHPVFSYGLTVCQWILFAITIWAFFCNHSHPSTHNLTLKQQLTIYRSIFLLQSLCIILFYALTTALNLWQPDVGINTGLPFHFSLTTITLPNGLFPWTAIALIAIALQQHNQRSENISYPMDCCPPCFHRLKKQGDISRIVNTAFQTSNQMMFVLFLVCVTLLGSAWLLQQTGHVIPTRNLLTSLTLLIVTACYLMNTRIKHRIYQLCQQTVPALLIISLSLVIMTLIITGSAMITPDPITPISTDTTTQWLLRDGWQPYWDLFLHYGWVGVIALLSPYLAYRGRGLSPRQLIIQILLLPLLLSTLPLLPDNVLHSLSQATHHLTLLPLLLISSACSISLLYVMITPKHRAITMHCGLPQPHQFKPRSITDSAFLLIGMTLFSLVLFMQQGILLLIVLLIARNVLLMVPVMGIAAGFLKKPSHSQSDNNH